MDLATEGFDILQDIVQLCFLIDRFIIRAKYFVSNLLSCLCRKVEKFAVSKNRAISSACEIDSVGLCAIYRRRTCGLCQRNWRLIMSIMYTARRMPRNVSVLYNGRGAVAAAAAAA